MLFQDLTNSITPQAASETSTFYATGYSWYGNYYNIYIAFVSGSRPAIGTTITVTDKGNGYYYGSLLISGDWTNNGVYYLKVYGKLGVEPTMNTELTCTYTSNKTYSEAIYTGLPNYSYIIGSYYNPAGRYSSLTTNIWARGSGTTPTAYPQNLNLYSQYSNFQLNNDLTGNYIGNSLYELDIIFERPNRLSTRSYLKYIENGTSTGIYRSSNDTTSRPIGGYSVPLASKYTLSVVDNITNAIIVDETAPRTFSTSSSGQLTIGTTISATASYGTIKGTTFNAGGVVSGSFGVGMLLDGTGVVTGTYITGGSAPNWTVNISQSTAGINISGDWVPTNPTNIWNGSNRNDYILRIYSYDDPYSSSKKILRLRAEDRLFANVLGYKVPARLWINRNTYTYPVTLDGSLILTNSTSTNTNSYEDTIVTCLDTTKSSTTNALSSKDIYYSQLTYMGYNDQDSGLKYTTSSLSTSAISCYEGIIFGTGKTSLTVLLSIWGTTIPYPGMIMQDIDDSSVSSVSIKAVSYDKQYKRYGFTLSSAWTGGNKVKFLHKMTGNYKKYTKDPANTFLMWDSYRLPYLVSNSYYYKHALEDRFLSPGFFTILPLYSIKKLDGTLIATIRDTTLFTQIDSPTTAVSRNYYAREISTTTNYKWWTVESSSDYTDIPPTKSASISNTKIKEFYYTYGPCIIEFTAVILKREITYAKQVMSPSPYSDTYSESGLVIGPPTPDSNYPPYSANMGYTETEGTEIIRIKVQETVVPMITPTVNLIRPSSLIGFNTTDSTYKINFNAARITTKYKGSNSILIEKIEVSGNTITITNHGLKNGQLIRYGSNGTVAKGLKNNNYYYVVYYNANTFGLTTDSTVIDITSTGSAGDQYIYLDSDRYILTSQLSKINNNAIYFDKPHNLSTGDRILYLAPTNSGVSSYIINVTHYTYYIAARVDDYAIKLLDTENNPITITFIAELAKLTIGASKTSNNSYYWNGSYTIDSTKDLVTINLNWSYTSYNYYIFDITINPSDYAVVTYEITSNGNFSNGDNIETTIIHPYGYSNTNYGSSWGAQTGGFTSIQKISIKVRSAGAAGGFKGTYNIYVKFTKSSSYVGTFNFAKLPDTIQEVTDKNAGYIGIGTETAVQAAPSKTLSNLTGTNLNVKLYADKTTATQLSSINIPIISNLVDTNAVIFQNNAAFYSLTEVGFLPTGADIKHYGIPQSNNNWNYPQYNTTDTKLNNKSIHSTTNGDITINTKTSILGISSSPANIILATAHGLSTGAPVRVAIPGLTAISTTNYNAITKVKRNSSGTGSLLGTASVHGYVTGDIVMYQKGYNSSTITYLNLLDVLIPGKKYYISVVDTTWFKLSNSPEEAAAGKGITFNSFGKFGTQIVDGVDTKTATIYFKYAQTEAADAVNYYYGTVENPVSAIYNQTAYDKTLVQGIDTSSFRFKHPGPDNYSQQVYTTSTGNTLATSTFDNIIICYLDKLDSFPNGINCYDTYYVIVVDKDQIRLAKSYEDAVAVTPNYIPIEPAATGTTAYIYTGVIAPKAITNTSVIKDALLLGTQNPVALSICWSYTLGTTNTSANNIDGFIVYVNTVGVAGSDPVNDSRYIVPYDDYYTSGKYNIVIYNVRNTNSRIYVAVAAYRYRNHYDYRHDVFFGTDAQELQISTLLKDDIYAPTSTSDASVLTLADDTTYTTIKRFFIPKTKLAYNGSQGYATPQSTLTIDGNTGTLTLIKNSVNVTDQLKSKYTTETTASYYIPYLSTSGTYQYIASKQTINYSSNTVLETYINKTDYKKPLFIKLIPSNFTSISGITLNTGITAPVVINNVSLDTAVIASGGGNISITQKVISIGPTIVQSTTNSLRLLIPVIDSSTNAISVAEIYYQNKDTELSKLNFTTVIQVLGT